MGGDEAVDLGLFFGEGGTADAVVQEWVFNGIEDPVARGGVGFEDFGWGKEGKVAR